MNETKVLRSLHPSSTTRRSLTVSSVLGTSLHRKCQTDLLLVIVYAHWSGKKLQNYRMWWTSQPTSCTYNTNHLELGQGWVNFNRRSGLLATRTHLTKWLTKRLTIWLSVCNAPLLARSRITGTRQSYSYSGGLIESRTWSVDLRHFQWPWTTPNPDLKIRPFFDAENLRNG